MINQQKCQETIIIQQQIYQTTCTIEMILINRDRFIKKTITNVSQQIKSKRKLEEEDGMTMLLIAEKQ